MFFVDKRSKTVVYFQYARNKRIQTQSIYYAHFLYPNYVGKGSLRLRACGMLEN